MTFFPGQTRVWHPLGEIELCDTWWKFCKGAGWLSYCCYQVRFDCRKQEQEQNWEGGNGCGKTPAPQLGAVGRVCLFPLQPCYA